MELAIVFAVYFIIINLSVSLGEELIFMFIAFTMSNIILTLFVSGIKGFINHPLISKLKKNPTPSETQKEEKLRIHEMSYIFMIFFAFIIGSTLAATFLSNTVINDFILPSLGATQGELLISGIITLATYLQMLYLFEEKLINPTSIGILVILAFMIMIFILFGGYINSILAYFGNPLHLLMRYLGINKSS
ncbi:MAG: hypothetical protein M1122_01565 [Candidatus Marsarchaeota archaeon]|nr:hypothetical protein [Candidatus Marsarchaeota archaeon]